MVINNPSPLGGLMPLLHYMESTGLLFDLTVNFLLVKIAATLGASLLLSCVFFVLWSLERHWEGWDAGFYLQWRDKDAQDVAWELCQVNLSGREVTGGEYGHRFDLLDALEGGVTPRNSPKATKGLLSSPTTVHIW